MTKSEIKKIDATLREINVEVSGERIKNKFEEVFGKIAKEAKVAGFRPGHAPRDIIEKNYSSHAQEQVLKELVPDVYNEVINQEKLDVIELPQISDVKLDRSNLSFKAKVEIAPQVTLKNYRGLKVNYKKILVDADEIKRSIDAIKESRKIEVVDESFAKSLGYPALAQLNEAVEKQLFIQKENQERQRIENEIIESLLKDMPFKVPQSLVNKQLEDMLRQAKVDLAVRGISREKIEEQEEALRKELAAPAEKQVRVYLVLAEIAKKENIALDDSMPRKVMELLLREAEWNNIEKG